MCKYSRDGLGDAGHWKYDIPRPTAELLAAEPQYHIDLVSDDYHSRDIYTAEQTSIRKRLPRILSLTAARFPYITCKPQPRPFH